MALVAALTFNPFQEKTYVVYDDTNECVIFDPGCYTDVERQELAQFIEEKKLTPVRLINTHCHLDHIFGNRFVADKYKLELEGHKGEIPVLEAVPQVSMMYGIAMPDQSPPMTKFIEEGDEIQFGNTSLKALFTPGHSPASLSFYCEKDQFVIGGDVLFYGSIGRTDLPGGDFNTLITSIREKFFTLPDEVEVHPGHGPSTTVGFEKANNPFLNDSAGS